MSSEPTPPPGPLIAPLSALARAVYLGLALLFLVLGIVGAFLPVLPTTPFILLSAWAAARSSPRLLGWLENHTAFGPMIRDWRRGGVVSRKAKWMSSGFMAASGAWLLWSSHPRWAAWAAIACMGCVAVWLWQRPESFPDEDQNSGRG
ncbi:MAG: YbaN family protein [Burkholderiaceae bacterium]|nr:YbaN family protein [Burkholderiaceae bacterium]